MSIDPFARNKRIATFTNDINPSTQAEYHMEAGDFLDQMYEREVYADLAIIDPPYSPRQVKECYDAIGRSMTTQDGWTAAMRAEWKRKLMRVLKKDAIVLTFGWNSTGMGKELGFDMIELLLVCHGADHNDTICVAERLVKNQMEMFI